MHTRVTSRVISLVVSSPGVMDSWLPQLAGSKIVAATGPVISHHAGSNTPMIIPKIIARGASPKYNFSLINMENMPN